MTTTPQVRRHVFTETTPQAFANVFDYARANVAQIADATSPFSHEIGTRYYLSLRLAGSGYCGYAIRSDGELVLVFSVGRGNGDEIVADAIANGATYLDCFDGYLPGFYARHGFVEIGRESNWTPGGPDVVFMRRAS